MGRNTRETIKKKYDKKIGHLHQKHQIDERRKSNDQIVTKWRELLPDLHIYKEVDGATGPPTPKKAEEICQVGAFNFKKILLLKE